MKNILNLRNDFDIYGSRVGRTQFIDKEDIRGKRILDLGCGYGWFLKFALDNGCSEAAGIEISETDLITAKESINDDKLVLKIGDSGNIPFTDNYFDTICAWEVIEHIPQNTEATMFAEIYRVLKPGGTFYLSTPYKSLIAMIFDPAWWVAGHRHYSKSQLIDFGEKNGFKHVKLSTKGMLFSLLLSLNMYFSKWVLKRKPLFEKFFRGKSSDEYSKSNGYLTIMCKYAK